MQTIVSAYWKGKRILIEPGNEPGKWTICVEFAHKIVMVGTSNPRFYQDIGDEGHPASDRKHRRLAYSIANQYRKGIDPCIDYCWLIGIPSW